MRYFHFLLLASALCLAPVANARADDAPPEAGTFAPELTLSVESTVAVDAQGALTALVVDTPLETPLRTNFEARVRRWKFKPASVDGVAHASAARMFVNLSARKQDNGFVVRVDRVSFRDVPAPGVAEPARKVTHVDVTPPRYPASVLRHAALSARVLMAVRVDAEGRVVEALPVQTVLLDQPARPKDVEAIVREFERAATASARKWRYAVAEGTTDPADLTVLYPVTFGSPGITRDVPGAWRQEMRGPRAIVPWLPTGAQPGQPAVASGTATRSPIALQEDVAGTAL